MELRRLLVLGCATAALLFNTGAACGSGPGAVLNGKPPLVSNLDGGEAGYDAGVACLIFEKYVKGTTGTVDCKNAPDVSSILDTSGQCVRDGYVAAAALYCWYAVCNPDSAEEAELCAQNLECDALELCGGQTPNPPEPCKSTAAFSCNNPPNIDCTGPRDCFLGSPVKTPGCTLKGSNSQCTAGSQCCSGTCATNGRCCPWVYGTCSSNADCCPGTICTQTSGTGFKQCRSTGSMACIEHDQCATNSCTLKRPGTSYLQCSCYGGGNTCCQPTGNGCFEDQECCSRACQSGRCK